MWHFAIEFCAIGRRVFAIINRLLVGCLMGRAIFIITPICIKMSAHQLSAELDVFFYESTIPKECGNQEEVWINWIRNEESIFVTLGCFSISLTYRCASCLAYACQKQVLYKQLGVTVNQLCHYVARWWCRLDTMLIGFFTRFFSPPKLSCSTDQTYKCLGSQLWVVLSSEESKKAITVSQP